MRTIIFIGLNKSGSSREAVKAANELGYYTVVFTNQEKQIQQRSEYKDVHQLTLVDLSNIEEIIKQIERILNRGNEIMIITSFVAKFVQTASMLADIYCENYLSTEALAIMENKEKTRLFFTNQSFTPSFTLLTKDMSMPYDLAYQKVKFPVVAKCATSTGSKDVIFAENMRQLEKNVNKLRSNNPSETIIIEEYVEGDQYLVEVLVSNWMILIGAVIKQEITKGKRFIVTGYGVLAEVPRHLEASLLDLIETIVSSLEFQNGAFHLELRLTEDGWKLIEINPRISGGAMNKMIHAAFGYSLVEETLKLLIGEIPSLVKVRNHYVFTQYVILENKGILEQVTGKGRAAATPGVEEVYVKPKRGTYVTPPLSMGQRYAYVIAKGDTLEEAENSAKQAANEITFHLRRE
ncbi:ATP-grasp domain-containing protein [Neobacillus niacini]|uniref:ATP-grasp domain-containing protein n=1 Tax=Neobacillus niacini TaxID=86668 RepID=UPI00203DBF61|nr:ATP-grasp domain-containing protein [Neobacillus niacini]MCM3690268.1 ATP-grasp domain-containing protein [Neobacillus niacini]